MFCKACANLHLQNLIPARFLPFYEEYHSLREFRVRVIYLHTDELTIRLKSFLIQFLSVRFLFPIPALFQKRLMLLQELNLLYQNSVGPGVENQWWFLFPFQPCLWKEGIDWLILLIKLIFLYRYNR